MRWLARQGDSSGILFSTIFKIKLRFSYIMTVHKWADIVIFRVISPPTDVTRSSPLCLFFYAPQAFVWHLNPGSLVHSLNLSRNARLVLFTVSPINEHKKRNPITSPNFRCHNLSVYWPPILKKIKQLNFRKRRKRRAWKIYFHAHRTAAFDMRDVSKTPTQIIATKN